MIDNYGEPSPRRNENFVEFTNGINLDEIIIFIHKLVACKSPLD